MTLVEMSAQGRGESSIDLLGDALTNHESADDFYAFAMRTLMAGWESLDFIEKYLAEATITVIDRAELKREVEWCLDVTPVPDFPFDMDDVISSYLGRNEWNDKELLWTTPDMYCLLCWGTSA